MLVRVYAVKLCRRAVDDVAASTKFVPLATLAHLPMFLNFMFIIVFPVFASFFASFSWNRVRVVAVASHVLYVTRPLAEPWFVRFLFLRTLRPPLFTMSQNELQFSCQAQQFGNF